MDSTRFTCWSILVNTKVSAPRAAKLPTVAKPKGMDCQSHRHSTFLTLEEWPLPNSQQRPRLHRLSPESGQEATPSRFYSPSPFPAEGVATWLRLVFSLAIQRAYSVANHIEYSGNWPASHTCPAPKSACALKQRYEAEKSAPVYNPSGVSSNKSWLSATCEGWMCGCG